jgi:hypothetical protein
VWSGCGLGTCHVGFAVRGTVHASGGLMCAQDITKDGVGEFVVRRKERDTRRMGQPAFSIARCEEPTNGSFGGTGRGLKAMVSRWRCTMKERASARTRESIAREKQRASK